MRDTIREANPIDEPVREIVCIVCPNGCRMKCYPGSDGYTITGNKCGRGIDYAKAELTRPMRTLTSSVKTVFADAPVVSVRTDGEIEKSKIADVLSELQQTLVTRRIKTGDVVIEDVCGAGVNVICTSDRLVNPY
jgi:CxxC motif-containing protein